MNFYRVLENPFIYNLSQKLLAPGYRGELEQTLAEILAPFKETLALELGAGTGAFSQSSFSHLTVTDINDAYLKAAGTHHRFVQCSATEVHQSFPSQSFDLIYSAGLYHHLSDDQYHQSIASCLKVLKPNGKFVVLDNTWPTRGYNLLAYLIRKWDRGRYVRSTEQQRQILSKYFSQIGESSGVYSFFNLEFNCFLCSF